MRFFSEVFLSCISSGPQQAELVLMNDETFSIDRLLAADVFQWRPTELMIESAEKISFADRIPQPRRDEDLQDCFKQERDDREADQNRDESK